MLQDPDRELRLAPLGSRSSDFIVNPPPKSYWLLPAAVALLQALPFLATFWLTPPEGQTYLHVGYIPEDMHAYMSFIRQVPDSGAFLFENRFVTEDQSGRFVLLFHWLLGSVSALTGVSPHWVIELSRIPLIFGFFAVLWWFLKPILPDQRTRLWAATLIGLSGGVAGFFRPLASGLPADGGKPFLVSTWHLYGWSTFEGLYNPLWISAFILMLVALRRLLRPIDDGRWWLDFGAAFLLVILWFVHPYSLMVAFAIGAARPIAQLIVEGVVEKRRLARLGLSLAFAAASILAVAAWQLSDPVFRASSGQVFGRLQLAVFWYPWTLGLLLVFAIKGGIHWIETRNLYCSSFLAWIGAVVLLHTSPIINGYHFVPYLHLPLSILAATVMPGIWDRWWGGSGRRSLVAISMLVLLLASPILVTLESVRELGERNLVPEGFVEMTSMMAELPPSRALVPPQMGLLVAAYTHHSVWAGHWFLTPDYWARVDQYAALVADPGRLEDLLELLQVKRIRYLVVPAVVGDRINGALKGRVLQRLPRGELELMVLRP